MTARWHLGPITGWEFWRVLVFSPEILVFLFFMITDPRTIPRTGPGRRAYAIGIGLLAVVLIAPQTTEFATKVAVLGALFVVCAIRPVLVRVQVPLRLGGGRARLGTVAAAGAAAFVALVVLAGIPARPDEASASALPARALPEVTVLRSTGVATQLDRTTAEQIARDVVANLGNEADAVLRRDPDRATAGAAGERLASVWARIDAAGETVDVPEFDLEHMTVKLERNEGQGPPLVLADLEGTVELVSYRGSPPTVQARGAPTPVPADARARAHRRPLPDRRLARADAARARGPGSRTGAGGGDRAAPGGRGRGVRAPTSATARSASRPRTTRPRRWAAGSAGSTTTATAGSTSTSSTRTRSRAT